MDLKKKHEIEEALREEHQEVSAGRLKEDNPLDDSDIFREFCEACRRGDLKLCQEKIQEGVNINARDEFDYTPLILASLCGHYEVVQLLLEAGALCERDTFQGERCLYNALNNRIRNLLLSYDYSKSADPLQPLAAHISNLLTRDHPRTSDITIVAANQPFHLHKFLLSARSPYFAKRLSVKPEITSWKLAESLHYQSFHTSIRFLYLGEVGADLGDGEEEQTVLEGIDKLGRQLEIPHLFEGILASENRRLARQLRSDEVERGQAQLQNWFKENIVRNKLSLSTSHAGGVKWDHSNSIFADVILRADERGLDGYDDTREHDESLPDHEVQPGSEDSTNGIPIGPFQNSSKVPCQPSIDDRKLVLFPAHRAMLIRSEYFATMFSSRFREAQETPYLQIIPIDCSPSVLEIVLTFLYTEAANIPLELAVETVYAADMLCIDKLKVKAAVIISTLGNGTASVVEGNNPRGVVSNGDYAKQDHDRNSSSTINIYDVIRAGWTTHLYRLEEFAARFIAYRLEDFIDEEDFLDLVRESAERIKERQETDTIELIDDIRYYLSERFRLRFDDVGLDVMLDDDDDDVERGGTASGATNPQQEPSPPAATRASTRNEQTNTTIHNIHTEKNSTRDGNHVGNITTSDNNDDDVVVVNTDVEARGSGNIDNTGTTSNSGTTSSSSRTNNSNSNGNDDTLSHQNRSTSTSNNTNTNTSSSPSSPSRCRTLDGELATDEYAQDAQNYRILLAKIDGLLDNLMLDA